MIAIDEKAKCCGCTACYASCPVGCIEMKMDEEGFYYPFVNADKCIKCGKCERVCPYKNHSDVDAKNESVYAALQHKDSRKRSISTAGGAFSLIADFVIARKGIVYAAGYDDNMTVCHKMAHNESEVSALCGSKYVQSQLNDTFNDIRDRLSKGIEVLFVGTPCQVHALKNCVGDKSNLYTIDLLCLGTSSPGLFEKYIDYLDKKYKSKVVNIQFRNKHYGYSTPNVRVYFKNGKEFDQKYDSKVHANLFFRYYNVRPSCYECEFREIPRVSDFTIGDFTEIAAYVKTLDDDCGTTKMWIHTEKGKELLKKVEKNARIEVLGENKANIVGGKKKQMSMPFDRDTFFYDAAQLEYFAFVSKWMPESMKGYAASILRPVINKLPFKKAVFQYLRKRKSANYLKRIKELNGK